MVFLTSVITPPGSMVRTEGGEDVAHLVREKVLPHCYSVEKPLRPVFYGV